MDSGCYRTVHRLVSDAFNAFFYDPELTLKGALTTVSWDSISRLERPQSMDQEMSVGQEQHYRQLALPLLSYWESHMNVRISSFTSTLQLQAKMRFWQV